jgi:hypothetical protein
MTVSAVNNDADNSHTLDTVTGTFTSTPSECASHLHVGPFTGIDGSYAAAQTKTGQVEIDFDNTAPASCAAGT